MALCLGAESRLANLSRGDAATDGISGFDRDGLLTPPPMVGYYAAKAVTDDDSVVSTRKTKVAVQSTCI